MNIKNIKKYVINLKRRPDRLESAQKEFEYIGWDDVNVFDAIDRDGYRGCALSHIEIAKQAKKENLDYILVCEDDLFFMPWAKSALEKCLQEFQHIEWSVFHFGPHLNRPVNNFNQYLIDLTNVPAKDPERDRGIYGTHGFIYKADIYDNIIAWPTNGMTAIDEHFNSTIYPNYPSFTCSFPIISQRPNYSDINKTFDNNHYLLTYNWNGYTKNKLPNIYEDFTYCQDIRSTNDISIDSLLDYTETQ